MSHLTKGFGGTSAVSENIEVPLHVACAVRSDSLSSTPFLSTQEAADRVLRPAKNVCRNQAELATGEGHVVRRRVLPLAHGQQ